MKVKVLNAKDSYDIEEMFNDFISKNDIHIIEIVTSIIKMKLGINHFIHIYYYTPLELRNKKIQKLTDNIKFKTNISEYES